MHQFVKQPNQGRASELVLLGFETMFHYSAFDNRYNMVLLQELCNRSKQRPKPLKHSLIRSTMRRSRSTTR